MAVGSDPVAAAARGSDMVIEATRGGAGIDAPPGMFTGALRLAEMTRPARLRVETFVDPVTGEATWLAYDEVSRIGVVVDPASPGDGDDTPRADLVSAIEDLAIDLHFSLETRDGARSGAAWLARRYGARVVGAAEAAGLSEVRLLPEIVAEPGDEFRAGPLRIEVLPATVGGQGVRYRVAGTLFPVPARPAKVATRRVTEPRRGDSDPAAAA